MVLAEVKRIILGKKKESKQEIVRRLLSRRLGPDTRKSVIMRLQQIRGYAAWMIRFHQLEGLICRIKDAVVCKPRPTDMYLPTYL